MRAAESTMRAAWVIVPLLAAIPACKKPQPTGVPTVDDDAPIGAVRAELDRTQAQLEAEGIVVPAPPGDEPSAAPTETPKPEQEQPPAPPSAPEPSDLAEQQDAGDAAPRVERARRGFFARWLRRRRREQTASERCERVCDLTDAICDLSERVCDLTSEHPDDVRYEDACLRARTQCGVADEACDGCGD